MYGHGDEIAKLGADIHEAEARIHKAATKNAALQACLDAAELSMRALTLESNQTRKKDTDRKCRAFLDQAEAIKTARYWSPTAMQKESRATSTAIKTAKGGKPTKEPVSKRTLSTREQIIILEGSKLNGFKFLPWKSPPNPSDFESQPGLPSFLDTPELCLSDSQLEIFDAWRRPEEIFRSAPLQEGHANSFEKPTMKALQKVDLVQDVTSDCSVVASLCAGTARAEHGHSKLLPNILYPYDHSNGHPAMSPNGLYVLRFHFNGCYRKLVIDDRLPKSRTSRTLHVVDRFTPGLLWPALIEKAYLKVRGGYDFPGSNSGTDLWVLTGWIPEQVFLQGDGIDPNALWRRIFKAYNYGDVLITIGTSVLTHREEEMTGLASEHDYAIIEMKEHFGRQLFLVKNPWVHGRSWKGKDGYGSLIERESCICTNEPRPPSYLPDSKVSMPGTFWMELSDVLQSFGSIYLNWNPDLFAFREDLHFRWDLSKARSPAGSFASNPQYRIESEVGGIVWILVGKHFKTVKQDQLDRGDKRLNSGFISLYAFDYGGNRVSISESYIARGPYVDSPNTLLRLELRPHRALTIVVSEQQIDSSIHSFTLSALSFDPVSLTLAGEEYSHQKSLTGRWTVSTSGGNASGPSYGTNPQFALSLRQVSHVSILLECQTEDLPVHIKILWADGKRVKHVSTKDIVRDSGEYRRGCAIAEVRDIGAGTYTVVCSTFEPNRCDNFNLIVKSTTDFSMKPIPNAEAGLIVYKLPVAMFASENQRLLAPLIVSRITRLHVIAKEHRRGPPAKASVRSPLKVSIELSQGPMKKVLVVSGGDEFVDGGASGVETMEIDVQPSMCCEGGLWIVLERLASSGLRQDEWIDVEILSTAAVRTEAWGTGEG